VTEVLLAPGTLAAAAAARTRAALAAGALQPLATECEIIVDGGLAFTVRRLASDARKEALRAAATTDPALPRNPFLPYDRALFVADITNGHVALLNKFNVVARHLIVVTRRFEHQERLLDAGDFVALAACLREFPALAFYNGGPAAGASQPHRHLQLVPLPEDGTALAPLLAAAPRTDSPFALPALGFRHAFAWLGDWAATGIDTAAATLARAYAGLLAATGIGRLERDDGEWQSLPYNLLATQRWMLVVPRSCECFGPVSVNALGFAGSLFVRDAASYEHLRQAGPLAVLRGVALPSTCPSVG
jgi:ATP adenylyltransferase